VGQAFVGCLKVPHCTSGVESDFGDGGNHLDCILGVGNSLEFAFLVWLSLMMLGRSLL